MDFMKEYEKWLHSPVLSDAERAELEAIKDDPKEIENRFFGPLEFGTAGLRGTMCVGLHNMNIHVIRWATQGFADVIAAEGEEGKQRGIAICMDCRNNSYEFAKAAAEVCAANGIHVRIFESLRPTPELSFAVRQYHCQAGINVTASHNPKEYNGYKVYWQDGAQLPPQHADAVAKRLAEVDIFNDIKSMPYEEGVKAGIIEVMGAETDELFMNNVLGMINDKEVVAKVADSFKMVYTPFHGCGYKMVPQALKALGIKHLICEPKQMVIDGDFPTVASPNPENPEGFYLAIDLAKENDVDFILGTDPDSDRVGIMIRDKNGEYWPVEIENVDGTKTTVYYKVLQMINLLPDDFFKQFAKYVVEDSEYDDIAVVTVGDDVDEWTINTADALMYVLSTVLDYDFFETILKKVGLDLSQGIGQTVLTMADKENELVDVLVMLLNDYNVVYTKVQQATLPADATTPYANFGKDAAGYGSRHRR